MCSGEGELLTNLYVGGFLNTNFKINQCQDESLVFSDPGLNVLESYTFGADIHTTQADHQLVEDHGWRGDLECVWFHA